MRRLKLLAVLFLTLTTIFMARFSFASYGVGVGTGKIVVDTVLKPGMVYQLPQIVVLNTGDVPSNYSLGVSYHEGQKERMPKKEWFIFEPSIFYLEPKETQNVDVKLNLSLKAQPGDYFAYVEAFPVRQSTDSSTMIAIAAASKLYFKIEAANIAQAAMFKIGSVWDIYQPWTTRALCLITVLLLFSIARKFVNVQINFHRKSPLPVDKHSRGKCKPVTRLY